MTRQDSTSNAPVLTCPVCKVRFRGTTTCSRCKTDLTALMRIAARAWAAREQCREALAAGNLPLAMRLAARARRFQQVEAM
jgi:predicted amidophosphoribosyltransferase